MGDGTEPTATDRLEEEKEKYKDKVKESESLIAIPDMIQKESQGIPEEKLEELKRQLFKVHRARVLACDLTKQVNDIVKLYEEVNKDVFEQQKLAANSQLEEETKLREMALVLYQEFKEKHLISGVEIKIFENLIYEPGKALAWAKEKGLALKLDQKLFEKFAKAEKPDFVEIKEIPQAHIAKDLEKIFEKEKE